MKCCLHCLFMGISRSRIWPYWPNISERCSTLTFLVSFSTTIYNSQPITHWKWIIVVIYLCTAQWGTSAAWEATSSTVVISWWARSVRDASSPWWWPWARVIWAGCPRPSALSAPRDWSRWRCHRWWMTMRLSWYQNLIEIWGAD